MHPSSGLTNREKWSLESKAKAGWKCYFIERDYIYDLQRIRNNTRHTVLAIRSGETPDISHLTNMFLELYDKVGQLCDCPICLDTMDKDIFQCADILFVKLVKPILKLISVLHVEGLGKIDGDRYIKKIYIHVAM